MKCASFVVAGLATLILCCGSAAAQCSNNNNGNNNQASQRQDGLILQQLAQLRQLQNDLQIQRATPQLSAAAPPGDSPQELLARAGYVPRFNEQTGKVQYFPPSGANQLASADLVRLGFTLEPDGVWRMPPASAQFTTENAPQPIPFALTAGGSSGGCASGQCNVRPTTQIDRVPIGGSNPNLSAVQSDLAAIKSELANLPAKIDQRISGAIDSKMGERQAAPSVEEIISAVLARTPKQPSNEETVNAVLGKIDYQRIAAAVAENMPRPPAPNIDALVAAAQAKSPPAPAYFEIKPRR